MSREEELEQRVQRLEADLLRLRYELWGERRAPVNPIHYMGDANGYPPVEPVPYEDMRVTYHGPVEPPHERLRVGDRWNGKTWNGESWEFVAA